MLNSVFVIAEAGVNHNGDTETARRLIDLAAEAGADAVKFQTFDSDKLVTRRAPMARYQIANTGAEGSQIDMLRALELGDSAYASLREHCRRRQIAFMSTAFDESSLALLARLDVGALKIPSGDISCGPLLLQAARLRRKLIVSTGMCTLADIEQALGVLAFGLTQDGIPSGRSDFEAAYASAEGRLALENYVTLLHCVTQYPAPPSAVNLRAMDTIAAAFDLPVGYSDHTLGIEVAIAAVARGATVLEKHFTLDRGLPGPDHAASLEPDELAQLVRSVRNVEVALGSRAKQPASEELANRAIARRSIVAARFIAKGEVLSMENMACKRPGGGVSPLEIWSCVGRRALRDFQFDEFIEL